MTPRVLLVFPPVANDAVMVEAGAHHVAAAVLAAGFPTTVRDLNVEFLQEYAGRRSTLRALAARMAGPGEEPATSRTPAGWAEALTRLARRSHLGPADPPLNAPREPSLSLDSLVEDPGFNTAFVGEAVRRFCSPRDRSVDAAVDFARRSNPLLDPFYDEALGTLDDARPELLGLSLWSVQQVAPAMRLAARARARWPGLRVVAGGPWCSPAEDVFRNAPELFDAFEALVIGAGENAAVEIARRVAEGRPFDGIVNTAVRVDGRVVLPATRETVLIGAAPLADYEGVRLDLYPERSFPIRLQQSCPWGRCRFCHHVFPNVDGPPMEGDEELRIERAVGEIVDLQRRFGVSFFHLCDCGVPWPTLVRFAGRLLEAGARVRWDAMARFSEDMEPEGAALLFRAGCSGLHLGLETTDPAMLARIHKGIGPELADRCLDLLHRAGLGTHLFMLSLPGQTREDLERDVAWLDARGDRIDRVTLARFRLGRGTRAFEDPAALGIHVAGDPSRDLDVLDVPFEGLALPDEGEGRRLAADLHGRFLKFRGWRPGGQPNGRNTYRVGFVPMPEPDGDERFSLGTAYLAAALRTLHQGGFVGIDVVQLDGLDHAVHSPERIAEAIRRADVDLAALGMFVWNHHVVSRVAQILRESPDRPAIVAGGPWIATDATTFAAEHPEFDVVIQGDAEQAFVQVVGRLAEGRTPADLAGIHGVTVGTPEGIRSTERIPVSPSLVASPYRSGLVALSDSMRLAVRRGCNKRCVYCNWGGSSSRPLTLEALAADLRWGIERGVRSCWFVDSSLNHRKEDLELIARAMDLAGAPDTFTTYAFIDHEHAEDERLELMRRIRLQQAEVGLQTITPRALKASRRKFDRAAFERGIDRIRTVSTVAVDLILGLPDDDPEGFRNTVDYVAGLEVDVHLFHLLALPGSEMIRNESRYGLDFNPDGIPWLVRSATFTPEDLAECAAYFVRKIRRKARASDYCTANTRFPRYPYNYRVPVGAYAEATALYGDPPPPPQARPGAEAAGPELLSALQRDLRALYGGDLEGGHVALAGCRLTLKQVMANRAVIRAEDRDGLGAEILLRPRTENEAAFGRSQRFDLWYAKGHTLPEGRVVTLLRTFLDDLAERERAGGGA